MSARTWVWLIGFVVAAGAGVATAHGLFVVAVSARVPAAIAWLYPLITDGLALVAYAATTQLRSQRARGYAWIVVVVAAGLSGLAQATYLAGAVTSPHTGTDAVSPSGLRAGVGAWPAIAAAIVAHLLFLIRSEPRTASAAGADVASETSTGQDTDHAAGSSRQLPDTARPAIARGDVATSTVQPATPTCVQSPPTPVHPPVQQSSNPRAGRGGPPSRVEQSSVPPDPRPPSGAASRAAGPAGDRARTEARRHAARHGQLPTVTALMSLAQVSRGTAGNALKDLRDQQPQLHVVHDTTQVSADQ